MATSSELGEEASTLVEEEEEEGRSSESGEDQSAELQEYCEQVFRICDRDGNGFISRDEVARFCSESGSDPLLDSIMSKLDTNHDGKITFDEFQAGFKAYGENLMESGDPRVGHMTSTPGRSGFLSDEEVYESDPSLIDDDGPWSEAMERLDPDGLLKGAPRRSDMERLWGHLARKDPTLLENFENFLTEVIEELKQSALDQASLEIHVRRVMDQHSKEVTEMEQLLEEQLSEVKADQSLKNASKTQRLSSHFARLLSDREAMISKLAAQESTLKQALHDKAEAEIQLRQERGRLLEANEGLQIRLDQSVEQLTVSRKAVARLSHAHSHAPSSEEELPQRSSSADPAGLRLVEDEEGDGEASIVKYFPPKKSPVHKASSLEHFPYSRSTPEGSDIVMDTKPNQSFVARQLFSPDSFGRKLSATSSSSQSQSPFESHDNHTTTGNKPQSDSPAASKAKASKSHDDHVTSKERSHDDHMTSKEDLQHPPQVQSDPFLRDQDVPAVGRVTPANDISLTFSGWMPRRGDLPRPSSPTAINRVFKVVFIGNSGVGKTSLILRLGEGHFSLSHGSTLGLDFTTKTLRIGNERVVFQLWDTAGQERFHSALTPVYFRRADAFVIVYDVSDRASFKNTKSWLSVISAALREHPPVVMLVGNKCDRADSRQVSLEEGRKLALELHAMFSEMSALSGDNVLQAHTTLAQLLLARENEELATARRTLLELNNQQPGKKWCAC